MTISGEDRIVTIRITPAEAELAAASGGLLRLDTGELARAVDAAVPFDPMAGLEPWSRADIPADRCQVDDEVMTFEEAHAYLDQHGGGFVECSHDVCPRACPNWAPGQEAE